MYARVQQAVDVLSILKPWWGVYLANMDFTEFDAGTDMNGEPAAMSWLSDDFQMYYDKTWSRSAPIMDIAVDFERQLQYKIRGGKSRLVTFSPEQREELLGMTMAMEVASSMQTDYESMRASGSLADAIMLAGHVDSEDVASTMRSLGEDWPEFGKEVYLPSSFGLPDDLSAEEYASLILEERERDRGASDEDGGSDGGEDDGDDGQGGESEQDESSDNALEEESGESGDTDGGDPDESRDSGGESDPGSIDDEDAPGEPDGEDEAEDEFPTDGQSDEDPGESRDEDSGAGEDESAETDCDYEPDEDNGPIGGEVEGDPGHGEAADMEESQGADGEVDGEPEYDEGGDAEGEQVSGEDDGTGEYGDPADGDEDQDSGGQETGEQAEVDGEGQAGESEAVGEGQKADQGGDEGGRPDAGDRDGDASGGETVSEALSRQMNSDSRSSWIARSELDEQAPVGVEENEDGGMDFRQQQEVKKEYAKEVLNAYDRSEMGMRSLGAPSENLVEWASYIAKSTGVDWQSQFAEITNDTVTAVKSMGMLDLSLMKRNPNQPPVGPIMMGLEGYDPVAFVLVDVSGSMTPFLDLALDSISEVVDAAFTTTSIPVTWIAADTDIVDVGDSQTPESVYKSVSRFGGSTDFAHVIEDVVNGDLLWKGEELPSPDVLFIISDGHFSWPWQDDQEPPMGTNIVFVQTGGLTSSELKTASIPQWALNKMVVVGATDDSVI